MEGVILSWQAWLIANTARKQTQNSFNHASWQRISLGAGTRHAIKGPIQTQSETLGDPQTQPGQAANTRMVFQISPTVKDQNAIHNSFGFKGHGSSTNTLIKEVQDATKDH